MTIIILVVRQMNTRPLSLHHRLPNNSLKGGKQIRPTTGGDACQRVTSRLTLRHIHRRLVNTLCNIHQTIHVKHNIRLPMPVRLRDTIIVNRMTNQERLHRVPGRHIPQKTNEPRRGSLYRPTTVRRQLRLQRRRRNESPTNGNGRSPFFTMGRKLCPSPIPNNGRNTPTNIVRHGDGGTIRLFRTPNFPLVVNLGRRFHVANNLGTMPNTFRRVTRLHHIMSFTVVNGRWVTGTRKLPPAYQIGGHRPPIRRHHSQLWMSPTIIQTATSRTITRLTRRLLSLSRVRVLARGSYGSTRGVASLLICTNTHPLPMARFLRVYGLNLAVVFYYIVMLEHWRVLI